MNGGTWNERIPTLEQERRFRRLIALHSMTDAWISRVSKGNEPAHRMERISRVNLNPNLWLFEKSRIDQLPLELRNLVGAQSIDGFLDELREFIWIIQASTLETIFSATTESGDIRNVLEQTSWNSGKSFAESVWGGTGDFAVKESTRAFLQSHPYSGKSFMTGRITERESVLIWKHSPLQDPAVKDSPVAATLCELHEHFIRGFFYALCRTGRLETRLTRLGESQHPEFTLLSTC